jgi:hypothetical protein
VKLEGKIRMIIKFKDGRGDDVTAELDLLVWMVSLSPL